MDLVPVRGCMVKRCPTLGALAGVNPAEVPVLLWWGEVFNRMEVKLGFKVICEKDDNTHGEF